MAAGAAVDPAIGAGVLGSGSDVGMALLAAEGVIRSDRAHRHLVEKQWARCAQLPIQLVVTITLPPFSLKEVLAMRKGQRIMSIWSSRDDVPLMVGDTFLANVTFEQAGSSLGVRISGFQAKPPSSGSGPLSAADAKGNEAEDPTSGADSDRDHTLADIRLPVSLCFGSKMMLLQNVLELTSGDAIVLERPLNGPVSIVVARRIVAQGELIAVKGFYGIRLQKLAELTKRLPEWHTLK